MQRRRITIFTSMLAGLLLVCQTAASPSAAQAAETTAVSARSAPFSDIQDHWAFDTIQWAAGKGIVDGYGDGTFRPDKRVTEAEFLAMLLRAFPSVKLADSKAGTTWYEKYYSYAETNNWPAQRAKAQDVCLRGRVAEIVAASLGHRLDGDAAVQFLLDQGLAEGKTAATAAGFAKNDPLTRGEAVKFIQNLTAKQSALSGTATQSGKAVQVRGLALGDPVSTVIGKLGKPDRKDASEYGFEWYVYNRDYANYTQIGVLGGKVVALFTAGADWASDEGVRSGSTKGEVAQTYGDPLNFILKGNTRFILSAAQTNTAIYLLDGGYVTFIYDKFRNNTVAAVLVVEKSVEESLHDFYGTPSESLRQSYEREIFDLTNAFRVSMGKTPLVWDDKLAETARKHSRDMAERGYFAHDDPEGNSPFDRMKADGLLYRAAAENIAAGLSNAIFAHAGWMNSEGHRVNLLGDTTRLGVGISFGGDMHVYYTQDFFTPYK